MKLQEHQQVGSRKGDKEAEKLEHVLKTKCRMLWETAAASGAAHNSGRPTDKYQMLAGSEGHVANKLFSVSHFFSL